MTTYTKWGRMQKCPRQPSEPSAEWGRVSACVRQRGPGGGSRRGSRVRHRPAAARSPAAARCSAPLLQKTKSCPSVATLTRGRLCLAECRPRRDLLAPAPSLALASAQLVTSARPGHTCSTHHAVTWNTAQLRNSTLDHIFNTQHHELVRGQLHCRPPAAAAAATATQQTEPEPLAAPSNVPAPGFRWVHQIFLHLYNFIVTRWIFSQDNKYFYWSNNFSSLR